MTGYVFVNFRSKQKEMRKGVVFDRCQQKKKVKRQDRYSALRSAGQ